MFNIEIDPETHSEDEAVFYIGRITLGDHVESFTAAAQPWDAARYEKQWRHAARELAGGAERTAFVTSFIHPNAHHTFIWAAWRVGTDVHLQEMLLLRGLLPGVLDVDRIGAFVPDHTRVSEDGDKISEWVVDLDDVARFAA